MTARAARPRAPKDLDTAPPAPGDDDPAGPLVVGLGASAGGLAALEQFFGRVSPATGLAFVVVQHLDPEHASALVELLQRVARIPVVEVSDELKVSADTIHVIPPNREMELFDGTLLLTVPNAPRGQRMAVDGFFRSLADERGAQAIGVVLSGTGSDGALGLQAIHDAGGICMAQEPGSAKFDGMPSAALRAVPGSLVAPAAKLPDLLARSLRTLPRRALPPGRRGDRGAGLGEILAILRTSTGRDFSLYRRNSVLRRVERRMAAAGLERVDAYARLLRERPEEVKTLFDELLINVTRFFRDPEAFDALQAEVLARLVEGKASGEELRVWVGGCASGEEAYTIAILLRERMEQVGHEVKVQIYGTDLDQNAISAARAGVYPASIAQDVSPERLRRFFVSEQAGYRVRKQIREQVVFAVQDLIKDPPFTRLDLVSCRNVFIYMEPELQARILTLFHYALRPGGLLFLSPAEGIGDHGDLFATVDRRWRIFRAQRNVSSARSVLTSGLSWVKHPGSSEDMTKTPTSDYAELTRRLLLQHVTPAAVLTDRAGTILFVHGETRHFLRPAPGQPSLSVAEMAVDGLQLEIRAAILRAAKGGKVVRRAGIPINSRGVTQSIDLTVRPIVRGARSPEFLLLSFEEARAAPPTKAGGATVKAGRGGTVRLQALTRELAYAKESHRATVEEYQTSHEELQSTNEELQSTNEELQASNEELVTAKEELQSVNEELTTVNAELQAKVDQLNVTQDDLKNLFDATSVGTIFLDVELRIKRFTREADRVFRLVPSDLGRPLADIKSNVVENDLLIEAQAVLDSLVPVERQVRCVDGTWFLARLQPYRTRDDAIRGVVLTFSDISRRMEAEANARAERELAERIVDAVRDPLLVLDGALRVVFASRSFHATFGTTPEAAAGRPVYELADRRLDLPGLRDLLEGVLPRDQVFERFEIAEQAPDGSPRRWYLNGRRIGGTAGAARLILLGFER
jgi:two-component system CheB/CheR fusion protein